MHTSPDSGSTLTAPGRYEPPEHISVRTSECVYQSLTLMAMLLVLASLWVF
ncbi:MAG: hypothetical protein WAL75_04735 [Terracidiphilus sp.]